MFFEARSSTLEFALAPGNVVLVGIALVVAISGLACPNCLFLVVIASRIVVTHLGSVFGCDVRVVVGFIVTHRGVQFNRVMVLLLASCFFITIDSLSLLISILIDRSIDCFR